jgi:hypothetical protein
LFARAETSSFTRRFQMMKALDLVQMLSARGLISASRVKDFKTSVQKLSHACEAPLTDLDLRAVATTYKDTLKTYFAQLSPSPSAYTVRNTLQNLGQIYRLADESGIMPQDGRRTPTTRIGTRAAREKLVTTSRYRSHYGNEPYGCPRTQWPPDIAEGWEAYRADRALETRETTLVGYDGWLACYVGYHLTVDKTPMTRWDDLFDAQRVQRFITWHAKRVAGKDAKVSALGKHVIGLIVTMAHQLERPEILTLMKLKKRVAMVPAMHETKRPEHTFTLQDLDAVGLAYMAEGRQPFTRWPGDRIKYPGLEKALLFQTGFLIRVWLRVPLRSKALREMDLDGRLYRDEQRRWHIYYRGGQLKIDAYHGETNEFAMPWPPELAEDLETYVQTYRPRFPHAESNPHLFLTERGLQMSSGAIWARFRMAIYQATEKVIWPHLLRKIWADSYLDTHPGDYEGVAAMLNNTPEMVQKSYRRFRREQHLQKAIDFNAELFNGRPKRKTP